MHHTFAANNFNFEDLKFPIVLAPMAGGPSTPALATAVANAGGFPFLAAGYLTPTQLSQDIAKLENAVSCHYGVNLFVPDIKGRVIDVGAYQQYREQLVSITGFDPASFPTQPHWSDDAYAAKLDIVLDSSATLVSFTFGYPALEDIDRIHAAGKLVVGYATSRKGILALAQSDVDVIGIQGIAAGGHRATVLGVDDDTQEDAVPLVSYARSISSKPIIAGGGIVDAPGVQAVLAAGANAVQVGTLFLTATEAGTKATHRKALLTLKDRETVITTAFTGRPARAIENTFTQTFHNAPEQYPQVHYLTAKMRKQAAALDDAEYLHLWAGQGFAQAQAASALAIMEKLVGKSG